MQSDDVMGAKSPPDPDSEVPQRSGTRLTVTIPPDDYEALKRIAKTKKVSASWVVRDAVEIYVQKDKPGRR
jgi:metal-responsive CopG/Arc/MetJ family transcriptional regulator